MTEIEALEGINRKLSAIIALLVEQRGTEGKPDREKDEILLARARLKTAEIAGILGKSEAAVKKAIQRGRGGQRNEGE